MIKRLFAILILFSSSIFCQANLDSLDWVVVDSVIYKSKQKPLPYLFNNLLDSAQAAFSVEAKKYYEEGAFCVHPPTEKPKFFGLKYGQVTSLQEYITNSQNIFPDSCILLFELYVDWQGNIYKAILNSYKGRVNLNWDFEYFLSNLKAIPAKYAGIPQNSKMMLPVRRR